MIIFHEGLPGSGKSWEAMIKHVLPAISNGREVYAWVEGLNHELIAKLLKIDLSIVQSLLHQLTPEEVPYIYKLPDNAFIVVDELQRFWGKEHKPSPEIRAFVAEHRHRGFDILGMGQDVRDCHELWKRRVDQKVLFTNLDMAGQPARYRWMLYKATAPEKYMHVSSGVGKYDSKYFGIYKSHVSSDISTGKYVDARANIFKTYKFYGAALVVLVGFIWGPYEIHSILSPDTSTLITHNESPSHNPIKPANQILVASTSRNSGSVANSVKSSPPLSSDQSKSKLVDYVSAHVQAGYRVRLVSVLTGLGRPPYVVVEFRDSSYRVQDRLTSDDLRDLGWTVTVSSLRLVRLSRKGYDDMIATAWPLEVFGAVSDERNNEIRERSELTSGRNKSDVKKEQVPMMISRPEPIPITASGRIAWSAGRVKPD